GAGELGHMTIDPSGPRCGCGKKGDLESWCSGKHIVERYVAAGGKMPSPDPKKIHYSKEAAAKKVMAETIDKLGIGLANMTAAFDHDAIILGGGVSNLPFYRQIRAAARKYKYRGQKSKTKILKGKLKSAGAIGAALLCTSQSPIAYSQSSYSDS
ncbi:ROK family protein, partial [Candidatus Woesearchaeota archaeon]|nr:ROK family protein [Candidatus Woesearchaeota archaeon]